MRLHDLERHLPVNRDSAWDWNPERAWAWLRH